MRATLLTPHLSNALSISTSGGKVLTDGTASVIPVTCATPPTPTHQSSCFHPPSECVVPLFALVLKADSDRSSLRLSRLAHKQNVAHQRHTDLEDFTVQFGVFVPFCFFLLFINEGNTVEVGPFVGLKRKMEGKKTDLHFELCLQN